jgi:hypothetical protein
MADSIGSSHAEIGESSHQEDLRSEIDIMRKEIDVLQIDSASKNQPWYKDKSTILATAALLFSFGTTGVSYHRTQTQDVQASRQELRGILQRLNAIPRDSLEDSKKYASDPAALDRIGQLFNAENQMLVRQAGEIVRSLPRGKVSATEYYEIGTAMVNAYDLVGAEEFLNSAYSSSKSFNDEVGALRAGASVEFLLGKTGEGRSKFQQALDIFSKYPIYSDSIKAYTNAYTEMQWAAAEANSGQLAVGQQHLDNAQRIIDSRPSDPILLSVVPMLATYRAHLASPNASATITTPQPPLALAPK